MGVYELSGAGSLKTGRTLYPTMNANNGNNYGAMVPIATATFTGSTSEVTFSSIPQNFQDLQIVLMGRSTNASTTVDPHFALNGDSSTIYSATQLIGNGSSATSERLTNSNVGYFGKMPGASTTSGILGAANLYFLNYASASTFKTGLVRLANDYNGSGTTELRVTLWRSTAAISSITLKATSGNWTDTTTATLYGIRAVSS
jgi:hypothetical protein